MPPSALQKAGQFPPQIEIGAHLPEGGQAADGGVTGLVPGQQHRPPPAGGQGTGDQADRIDVGGPVVGDLHPVDGPDTRLLALLLEFDGAVQVVQVGLGQGGIVQACGAGHQFFR